MRVPIVLAVAISCSRLMFAACTSSDEHRDPETPFSALSGTSIDDTAIVTGIGDGISCFASKAQLDAYSDAHARGDEVVEAQIIEETHDAEIRNGDKAKFVDNATGAAKIELVDRSMDCWIDSENVMFKDLHHSDRG